MFACLIFGWNSLQAQNNPQIEADRLIHDFGTIEESNGPASYVFKIRNTGDAPLIITRITASCGCTQPEWTKDPIAPGETGEVQVTYNPKGRPGPFYKTISIYSNGHKGSYSLGIKGHVTPKQLQPVFIYPYSIADLKLENKQILFSNVRPDDIIGESIQVMNEGETTMTIHIDKTPAYLTVTANPEKLAPGETGQISLLLDAKAIKKKGRISVQVPISITTTGVKKQTDSHLDIAANIIDNFNKLTAADKAKAPVAKLSSTLIDLGKMPESGSAIPFIKRKTTETFDITNEGKTPLIIYSATCDDKSVDISGGKREIKPGATATFKVSIRSKDIKTRLETLINIVCNDPNGPVRLIKITAEK